MTPTERINQQLKQEIVRLKGRQIEQEEFDSIIKSMIADNLSDKAYLRVVKSMGKNAVIGILNYTELLQDEGVKELLTKIIGIMEISDTWEEFEKMVKKKKPRKEEEPTDFDKILKAMLKVPPPKEKYISPKDKKEEKPSK